jgi:hypothetical protein
VSGHCDGACQLISAVSRDMGKATDDELAGIPDAVADLLDRFEGRMGGDLVTALCRWRETAQRYQKERAAAQDGTVTALAGKRAS